MDSLHGKLTFDGTGDVQVFLTKVEIQNSLKGYTGESLAQAIASRLEGPAFDVYLRMSSDDRKDASKIKAELLKEFERGKRNREGASTNLETFKAGRRVCTKLWLQTQRTCKARVPFV